jgi:hypothetical protein
MTVGVLSVGVMTVGVLSVGVMTVGVLSVGVMTLSRCDDMLRWMMFWQVNCKKNVEYTNICKI